jgi:hypothetical protein
MDAAQSIGYIRFAVVYIWSNRPSNSAKQAEVTGDEPGR